MTMKCFVLFVLHLFNLLGMLTIKPNAVVADPFGSESRINAIRGEPFYINCCWTKGHSLSFFDRIIIEEGDESGWAQEYNRLYQTGAQCARLDIGNPGDRDKGRYECRTFESKKPKEYVVFLKYELEKFKGAQSLLLGDPKANKINIQVTGSLPIVKWYKVSGTEKRLLVSYEDDLQKQIFDPNLKYQVSRQNGSLIVNNLEVSDAGVYEFNLDSSHYGNKKGKITVKVDEQVKIITSKTEVVSVNHDQITVRCTAIGTPKPIFSFFLPKTKIDPESIKTNELDDGRTVVAEYTFTGGEPDISCTVSNIHGTDKVRMYLPKIEDKAPGAGSRNSSNGNELPGEQKPSGGYGSSNNKNQRPDIPPSTPTIKKEVPVKTSSFKDFFKNKEAVKGLAIMGSAGLLLIFLIILVSCKCYKRRKRRLAMLVDGDIESGKDKKRKRKNSKHGKGKQKRSESKGEKKVNQKDNKNDKNKPSPTGSVNDSGGKGKNRTTKQNSTNNGIAPERSQTRKDSTQRRQGGNNQINPSRSRRAEGGMTKESSRKDQFGVHRSKSGISSSANNSQRRPSSNNSKSNQKKRRSSSRQ